MPDAIILSVLKLFQRDPVGTCWNKNEMHVGVFNFYL